MADTANARKTAFREKLILLAERQIATGGLSSLRARALAQQAGCALGAIYTGFDDLTALAIAVNSRTFLRLQAAVLASAAGAAEETPVERLVIMGHAYLRFASDHRHLWRALFEVGLDQGCAVPEGYHAALEEVFGNMAAPLAEIYPELSAEAAQQLAQTLFSAVHGIVALGLGQVGPPQSVEQMEERIALLLFRVH